MCEKSLFCWTEVSNSKWRLRICQKCPSARVLCAPATWQQRAVEQVSGMTERKEAEEWAMDEGEREKKSSRRGGRLGGAVGGMKRVWTVMSPLQWVARTTKTAAAPPNYGGSRTRHLCTSSLLLIWVFKWHLAWRPLQRLIFLCCLLLPWNN